MSDIATIKANVLLRLAQNEGEIFTTLEVVRQIQREYEHALTEINMKNDEFLAQQVTFETAGDGGTSTVTPYAFPGDFEKLLNLEIKHSASQQFDPVPYVSVHSREAYKNRRAWLYNQYLTYYYIIGNNFFFVPDQAPPAGGDNVRMVYIYRPPDLTTVAETTIPVIPEQYHEILEIGAANRLRHALKEPPIDVDEYNQKLLQMTETISPRVKHNPKAIRMIPGGLY